MTEILIATLVILLMASFAVNGYLLGARQTSPLVNLAKEPETKPQAAANIPTIPRQPESMRSNGNDNPPAGMPRRIVSPSEAIAADRQKRDGLVRETPRVPAAIKDDFLKDAGAVVASPANKLEAV
jgi:hypothetical protein